MERPSGRPVPAPSRYDAGEMAEGTRPVAGPVPGRYTPGHGRRGGVRAVEAAERRVYEKILLAHYLQEDSWDGRKHRQTLDRCLGWLLTPEDVGTVAYLQFEYLRGRDPDFIDFLRGMLGVSEDARARQDLLERYGELATNALAAARARGSY